MTSSIDRFLGGGLATPPREEVAAAELIWPEKIKHLSATSIGMFRRC